MIDNPAGMPEWSNGAVCKTVALTGYLCSNPGHSTESDFPAEPVRWLCAGRGVQSAA